MGQPEYAFDKTFCSAALLRALAEEYGTPLWFMTGKPGWAV